jgi:rhamnosyltransferase
MTKKRCCIFAHFDPHNVIDPYVLHYLDALLPHVSKIIFVSTSQLKDDELSPLKSRDIDTIIRENSGYDFFSWKLALEHLDLNQYDEILQVNDSCYAPLFSFEKMFRTMETSNYDFWGITKSYRFSPHLQSYFVCYRRPVISSETFQKFWRGLQPLNEKYWIVKQQEVGISKALLRSGFKMGHLFKISPQVYWRNLPRIARLKYKTTRNWNPYKYLREFLIANPSIFYQDDSLKNEIPFIKVALISGKPIKIDPTNLRLIKDIDQKTVDLLGKHQHRLYSSDRAAYWAPSPEEN